MADAENIRRRAQLDIASAHKFGAERLVEMLLPVIDSLEAALAIQTGSAESLRDGVELTLKQLKSVLEKANVSEISPAAGEKFDPNRHHAMAAVEAKADQHRRERCRRVRSRACGAARPASRAKTDLRREKPSRRTNLAIEGKQHGKDHRYRPWHHQLVRCDHGGRQAQSDRNPSARTTPIVAYEEAIDAPEAPPIRKTPCTR